MRILLTSVGSDVLPGRGDGAQPVSQAHRVEGSAAAGVLARVVRRTPAVSTEFVIWRIREARTAIKIQGPLCEEKGLVVQTQGKFAHQLADAWHSISHNQLARRLWHYHRLKGVQAVHSPRRLPNSQGIFSLHP